MNKTNDVKYHLTELLMSERNLNKTYVEIHRDFGIKTRNS